jgi:two-component SAPR family response regulator
MLEMHSLSKILKQGNEEVIVFTLSSTYERIEELGCISRNLAFMDISVSSGSGVLFSGSFSVLQSKMERTWR